MKIRVLHISQREREREKRGLVNTKIIKHLNINPGGGGFVLFRPKALEIKQESN